MDNPRTLSAVISTSIIAVALLAFTTLNGCSGSSSCDGKKCKTAVGLDPKISLKDLNSQFVKDNPSTAKKFKVYVESSASMDGYVTGHTDFGATIYRLIGQVKVDVLEDEKNLSLNYINSDTITNKKGTEKQFKLSPEAFAAAGGDRANSDIIDILSQVVKNTSSGEVSMFVSDCVYSPEAADDIQKELQRQQTDMLNILKSKVKESKGKDSKFGILLYRLESDFHGIYYTKTNAHIQCDGPRPYFVWFFGDESILAGVYESITEIMTEKKADYIVGIHGYQYVPYNTVKSIHNYHFLNAKTKANSCYTFSFIADMSKLPLSKEYIMNKANYHMGKDKYSIEKIEEYSDSKKSTYNYKYTIRIKGGKNSFVTPTTVEISLNSMLVGLPKWVSQFNDPDGNDYNNGYIPSKLRTFGLQSLVDGIKDYYKNPYYVTFKIQIN